MLEHKWGKFLHICHLNILGIQHITEGMICRSTYVTIFNILIVLIWWEKCKTVPTTENLKCWSTKQSDQTRISLSKVPSSEASNLLLRLVAPQWNGMMPLLWNHRQGVQCCGTGQLRFGTAFQAKATSLFKAITTHFQ